ncbi:MAG: hypothetical protein KIH01_02960 [Candidatus Freyarchaeota archaeon]|nr:hypothetical protein [Candidatus Jordarchaeia archaeon]
MMSENGINRLIMLVELNVGKWKPLAVAIVDINNKVWGKSGEIPQEYFDYYKNFPLKNMHIGDSVHNRNSFLMKVTDKVGIIVVMQDPHLSRLASINLRGRLNVLSEFYTLEKHIREKMGVLDEAKDRERRVW